MTTTVTETLTTARRGGSATAPRRRRTLHRAEARGAWVLMSPYVLLFLVAAAIPIGYAFYISLQKPATLVNPQTGFGGLDAFVTVVTDYRFIGTFVNIFSVMIIWLPLMIVGVVGLALLDPREPRTLRRLDALHLLRAGRPRGHRELRAVGIPAQPLGVAHRIRVAGHGARHPERDHHHREPAVDPRPRCCSSRASERGSSS